MTDLKTDSKGFLQNILESMEGGVLTVDLNGRITSFNASAEEISGFSRQEALGQKCCNILRSEMCEDVCPLTEVLNTNMPVFNYEVILLSKTGKKVPVNITTSPLRSGSGEIVGAVENFRDLTKHKGLWGKLREERNRAQQYLNIAGVIIVAINEEGIITLINKKGCQVIGYNEEEIVGKNWFDLCVPENDREERKAVFDKVMRGEREEAEDYENFIKTKSGEQRFIAWHNTTLYDEKGSIVGTLSSGNDITEKKQAEIELIRAEKLASLGQLAASVAHEVNNPLAGILVYITLLLKKYEQKSLQVEGTQAQLLKIKKELERTTRIIKNLLDFSRQSEPNMRKVEFNSIVDAALQLVEHQISLENIQLIKNLDPKIPAVKADFDKMQQVLINVILNANQAMPEGGTLTIATSLAERVELGKEIKNAVRIDISDTGVGIAKENLDKLFTPFFTTKDKGKGVGLGLPVVHGIIEQHRGKIEVKSEPGSGTTFTIYLEALDGNEE